MADDRPTGFIPLRERIEARRRTERLRAPPTLPKRVTIGMALGTERVSRPVEIAAEKLGWVYFIQAACGSIKIGRARNVAYRIRDLQCANPQRLTLLAVAIDGGREAGYHRQFKDHRLHGEWFSPHPDILAEIERLK